MNLKESPRRLWALIGAGGTLLIVAVSYLLLISGQKSTEHDLDAQAESARQVAVVTKHKLADLQQDNKKLPQYKTQLAALQEALPKSSSTAQFGADLHALATKSGVTITSINASPPTTGTDPTAVAGATALPITIAATGETKNLERFLGLLQSSAPRAVLVGSVSETVPTGSGSGADSAPIMNIGLKAFFGHS